MEKTISIWKFLKAIYCLPNDEQVLPRSIGNRSQKEHWLFWLLGYFGPGFYGRQNWHRDAKFAYNHIVCPEMLVYLAHAIPLKQELIDGVDQANLTGSTMMEKLGVIRKVAPWAEIYQAFWGQEGVQETKIGFKSQIIRFFK